MPWRRRIFWSLLLFGALTGSRFHWWIFAPAAVGIR